MIIIVLEKEDTAMTTKLDKEQRFAAKTVRYTQHAYQTSLRNGQKVVEIIDGDLVETSPDGSSRFLKKASPKYKVSTEKKIKVT